MGSANQNLFAIQDSEEVNFQFDDDPNAVGNVDAALNDLAARDANLTGMEGLVISAGPTLGGGAKRMTVTPGQAISNNPATSIALLALAALATVDIDVPADQAGDGIGGAFVDPVAGSYIGVHLIIDQQGVVRVGVTGDGLASAVQPDQESFVATLGPNDRASKLIGVVPVGFGADLMDSVTESRGGELRSTTLIFPTGDLSAAAFTAQQAITSAGDSTPLALETPTGPRRRKVTISYEITDAPGGGALAIGNELGVSHGDGDAEFSAVQQIQITENAAGVLLPPIQTVVLYTDTNGRTIQFHGSTVEVEMNARIVTYDTDFS